MDTRLSQRLGSTARRARLARGLTQADVAEELGIATEVYGRLERGKMLPSVQTLIRLSVALELSADALLGLTPGATPQLVARERGPSYDAEARLRPLVRTLRQLDANQLRVLAQVANALKPRRNGKKR